MIPTVVLYSRESCHLCESFLSALQALQAEYTFELQLCDIDQDPVLRERYNADVPVLTLNDVEICRHFFDEAAFRSAINP